MLIFQIIRMEVMHHPNKPFASHKGAAHSSVGHPHQDQHHRGDPNTEGHQANTPALNDLRCQGGSPAKEGAGANTQMMKALKLFAKNHQELEKVSDPEKGNHGRRVLSYDSRTSTSNVPASTFEKCGGTIPSGPKFVNELVEKELSNYKAEVEIKYKASIMNTEYVFQRRKSAKASGSSAVAESVVKPDFFLNNFTQAAQAIPEEAIQAPQREGSASPQSRTIDTKARKIKEAARGVTDPRGQHPSQQQNKLNIQQDEIDKDGNLLVRCDSFIDDPAMLQQQERRTSAKATKNQRMHQILDDMSHPPNLSVTGGGISSTQQTPVISAQGMVNGGGTLSAGLTNTALNSFLQSPARQTGTTSEGQKGPVNNYQQFMGLSKGPKNDAANAQPQKVKQLQKNLINMSGGPTHPSSGNQDQSSFFKNINQVFNKTVFAPGPSPTAPQQQPRPAGESASNNPHQQEGHAGPTNTTSIVINKPIVIQFQNKKITFKNHHHHHHHHHNEGSARDTSHGSQNNQQRQKSTEQMSPKEQKAPASQAMTNGASGFEDRVPKEKVQGFHSSFVQTPHIQPLSSQHVKFPSNQQKHYMTGQGGHKKPPLLQGGGGQPQPQHLKVHGDMSHVKHTNNKSVVVSSLVLQQPLPPSSALQGPKKPAKKAQVNQILQHILQFDGISQSASINKPPSPKTIEYLTQQVRQQHSNGEEAIYGPHSSLGGSFAESNTLNRPRQSEQASNREAIGHLNYVNALKFQNISNNFGISKTQDSKNHSNGGGGSHQNTYHSRDNNRAPEGGNMIHGHNSSQNTSQILNELTLLEYMRNHSNENVSIKDLPASSNHLQASYNANFRHQVPTGTKLVINSVSNVQPILSMASKKNVIAKKGQHVRYKSNNVGSQSGVESPSHMMMDAGLVASLTMDNSKKQTQRAKVSQASGQQPKANHPTLGLSGQIHHQQPSLSQNSRIMSVKGASSHQQSTSQDMKQSSSSVMKKKKGSLGTAINSSVLNSNMPRSSAVMGGQSALGINHQTSKHFKHNSFGTAGEYYTQDHSFAMIQSSHPPQQQQQPQAPSRASKKVSMSSQQPHPQQPPSKHSSSNDRYLSSLKDQLLKAAYHTKTSFNSPNRYSQHHQAPIPLVTAAQASAMQNAAASSFSGGLFQESQTLDERGKKVVKLNSSLQVHQQHQPPLAAAGYQQQMQNQHINNMNKHQQQQVQSRKQQ